MFIRKYGFRSKYDQSITEKDFKVLNEEKVLDIIYLKDKILEKLEEPTMDIYDEELPFISNMSMRHYGVVFEIFSIRKGEKETSETAKVYFFNNGEIHYVPYELCTYGKDYHERDDDVIEELDKRMDFKYKLLKEKMFIAELYEKTKPRNKELMNRLRKQLDRVLTQNESIIEQKTNKTLKLTPSIE